MFTNNNETILYLKFGLEKTTYSLQRPFIRQRSIRLYDGVKHSELFGGKVQECPLAMASESQTTFIVVSHSLNHQELPYVPLL